MRVAHEEETPVSSLSSRWPFTIHPMPCNKNVLSLSLNKTFPSFNLTVTEIPTVATFVTERRHFIQILAGVKFKYLYTQN